MGTNKVPFHVKSQLPMYQSQICESGSNYLPKSLDGGFMDRELAHVFMQNNRSGGDQIPGMKLSSETTHGSVYQRHTKDGRGENCRPTRECRAGQEQLMETESYSRSQHQNFDRSL